MSWNATRLGAAAAMGVLAFLINLVTGMLIVTATGIPAGGAPLMAFICPMILVLIALLIPFFPSATLASAVWGVLALAAPIVGPPGFLPKLIAFVAMGLACDIPMWFLRSREKIASIVSGLTTDFGIFAVGITVFVLFLPPELAGKFIEIVHIVLIACVVLGPIGGLTGWKMFDVIRNRAIVVRLRGGE